MTYPTTPPGDDPTRDFGAPPPAEPPVTAYPPGSASVAPEPAPYLEPAGYPTSTWMPPATPEPPRRSMTWVWVTIAAVVVVAVFAVGVVGVVLLARSGGDKGTAAPPTPGASQPAEPARPTEEPADEPTGPGEEITLPDTVGGLKKSDNPAFAGLTDQLKDQMGGLLPSIAHVGVGMYDDPDSTLGMAVVMRMDLDVTGSTAGAVDGAFQNLGSMGKVSGTRTVKPPAPLTGPGKCANVESSGVQMAVCVAADKQTVSMVMFLERKAKEVVPVFNKIRLDLVP